MTDRSYKQWFFQRLALEAFYVFAATYVVLLILELLKEGIVSRYISLPHAALLLLVLGILALAQQPQKPKVARALTKKEYIILCLISVALIIIIPLILKASVSLTILLIFVTVVSLWIGTIYLLNSE